MTLAVNLAQGASNNVTFRNRIINGGMVLDQRNAGASVTPTNGQYLLDRWAADVSQASKFTVIQSSTAPAGFSNSLLVTSSSAYTVGTNDYFALHQFVEGFNIADFSFGSASATYITLSFWVRSSLTGTFGVGLRGASNTRSYTATYTISTANTFEYKTITIPGDTSGTWLTTNGVGIGLFFSLGVGSANSTTAGSWQSVNATSPTGAGSVVGTNGATFYITGVQLEAGTTASPFEYRQYGTELGLCQRYFQRNTSDNSDYPFSSVYAYTTSVSAGYLPLAVPMRTTPTAAIVTNMALNGYGLGSQTLSSLGTIYSSNGIGSGITIFCNPTTTTSSLTANQVYALVNRGGGGYTLSAEL